jgi:hypothetical protein
VSKLRVSSFAVSIDGYGPGRTRIDLLALGYECAKHVAGDRDTYLSAQARVTHGRSGRAGAMTGAIANLTCGSLLD